MPSDCLDSLGREAGCRRLSADFYSRVAGDPVLRPLFPGKSMRCATNELAAFLIQFLDGDEAQTQHRWWLSLRESHARFRIGPAERAAWLTHMHATLEATPLDPPARAALRDFFLQSSAYVIGKSSDAPRNPELAARWTAQLTLDATIAAIAAGRDQEALALAPQFAPRRSVFAGLLARMLQSARPALIRYVLETVESNPALATHRFNGRTLLHVAAGAGSSKAVTLLLRLGVDPNVSDGEGHTALYSVANQCASAAGPPIVRDLVAAGADVDAAGGVSRLTPLHAAARRGNTEVAAALLDTGAALDALDAKRVTPLQRARQCRKQGVAELLASPRSSEPRT